jgi:hypothetical protein
MMVSQDVYSAYAAQHKHNLMQAAEISRFLNDGQHHSWKSDNNTPNFVAKYLKRFLTGRTRYSKPARKDVKDEEGLVVGERFQSI